MCLLVADDLTLRTSIWWLLNLFKEYERNVFLWQQQYCDEDVCLKIRRTKEYIEQGSELFQVLNKFFLILKHLLGLLCSPHVLLLNHHQLYSYLLSYNKKKRKVWHKSFNTARGSVHHHSLFVVCLDIVVCRGT